MSAALGVAVVACIIAVACAPANECVPDVASILAAAGFPLVPDFLSVAGSAVAFIPAVGDVSAVAVVPAVDGSLLLLAPPLPPPPCQAWRPYMLL